MEKICPICGKKFEDTQRRGNTRKYCSADCRRIRNKRYYKRKAEMTCIFCGKKFFTEHGNQRYCSALCRTLQWRKWHNEYYAKHHPQKNLTKKNKSLYNRSGYNNRKIVAPKSTGYFCPILSRQVPDVNFF